jgi:hypothetical protein
VIQAEELSRKYLHDYFFDLRPPLRLADFPALAIFADRVLDIPLRFNALYFFLFLIELPAIVAPVVQPRMILTSRHRVDNG